MKQIIAKYNPRDVFNMDGTGLYYRMLPDRTLTMASASKGTKKAKIRISFALTANATGTEKLTPLVIGHSKKPCCIKHFNPSMHANYYANKKAWMTAVIFSDWLKDFDRERGLQNRKILLLLDNATSHIVPTDESGEPFQTSQFTSYPPTTTSHLQPMDAGIIKMFKAHYRRYQIQHMYVHMTWTSLLTLI